MQDSLVSTKRFLFKQSMLAHCWWDGSSSDEIILAFYHRKAASKRNRLVLDFASVGQFLRDLSAGLCTRTKHIPVYIEWSESSLWEERTIPRWAANDLMKRLIGIYSHMYMISNAGLVSLRETVNELNGESDGINTSFRTYIEETDSKISNLEKNLAVSREELKQQTKLGYEIKQAWEAHKARVEPIAMVLDRFSPEVVDLLDDLLGATKRHLRTNMKETDPVGPEARIEGLAALMRSNPYVSSVRIPLEAEPFDLVVCATDEASGKEFTEEFARLQQENDLKIQVVWI